MAFLRILVIVVGMMSAGWYALADSDNSDAQPEAAAKIELSACNDKELGVEFLCNANWELETDQDAILVIISEDPAVTFTVARMKSPVTFIEELSNKVLKEMGQYADPFEVKLLKLSDDDAVEVNAFAEDFPEIQLRDFYVLHGDWLYSILFSVSPPESFAGYQPLFNKILDSIKFSDQGPVASDQ